MNKFDKERAARTIGETEEAWKRLHMAMRSTLKIWRRYHEGMQNTLRALLVSFLTDAEFRRQVAQDALRGAISLPGGSLVEPGDAWSQGAKQNGRWAMKYDIKAPVNKQITPAELVDACAANAGIPGDDLCDTLGMPHKLPHEQFVITPEMAKRLERLFPQFSAKCWLALESQKRARR